MAHVANPQAKIMSPFPIVQIEGAPRERGEAYGAQAVERIGRSLSFYEDALQETSDLTLGHVVDVVRSRAAEWASVVPDLMLEVEGIAAGAGRAVEEVLALNARDTFMYRASSSRLFDDGCTSFAVLPRASRNGHMLSGQNWDYDERIQDTIVLLHVAPDVGPPQLIIVEAGQVGRQGANAAGLSLQANGLPAPWRDDTALPGPFFRRRVLESESLERAVDVAFWPARAGRTNLLISHAEGVSIDLEVHPHSARWLLPGDSGTLLHANHFQAEIPPELAESYAPAADSLVRLARASEQLRACSAGIAIDDLRDLCRDHAGGVAAICRHRSGPGWQDRTMTVASTITDLTTGVMEVAAGPTCEGLYVSIDIASGTVIGQEPRARTVSPAAAV